MFLFIRRTWWNLLKRKGRGAINTYRKGCSDLWLSSFPTLSRRVWSVIDPMRWRIETITRKVDVWSVFHTWSLISLIFNWISEKRDTLREWIRIYYDGECEFESESDTAFVLPYPLRLPEYCISLDDIDPKSEARDAGNGQTWVFIKWQALSIPEYEKKWCQIKPENSKEIWQRE